MSQNLKRNKDFLTLLLKTEKGQAKALLETITQKQLEAVIEILYNLMRISSVKKDKTVIQKRKTLLRELVNKKVKLGKKKQLVGRHRIQLMKTLLHFKSLLLSLIK